MKNILKTLRKLAYLKKIFISLLVLASLYIFCIYIKWGVVEAFKHHLSFDEGGILTLISNFARSGRYESQFNYYNYPKYFDPFMSIGPPFIMILAILIKIFGYHYFVVGLIILFFVNIPLILSTIFLINILISQQLTKLNRLIISILLFVFLISNRLFYSSPPTGGSFIHGPIGEPFSFLCIILSSIFLFFGIKNKRLFLIIIAGFFSSLAYETKNIAIIFFISQLLIYIIIIFLLKFNKKNVRFFSKGLILFALGFVSLIALFLIWERTNFNSEQYAQYLCWKKVAFITKGSGFNNLFRLNINRMESSFNSAVTVIINFYSDDIGGKWGTGNKFLVTSFFSLLYFSIVKNFIFKIKLVIFNITKLSNGEIAKVIIDLSLVITFFLGTFWYFFISDFQWIRHFYIFLFIGFMIFYRIFIESINKKLLNILLYSLLIFLITTYLPKSPLNSSYHFREIFNYSSELQEKKFISFYKNLPKKKTYVCGYFILHEITFLSGYRFYNNILEDKEDVFPRCNSIPDPKLKKIPEKEFNFIYTGPVYPECKAFLDSNIANLNLIYTDGYQLYTTK